jgi:N-acetylneuraminate synthase
MDKNDMKHFWNEMDFTFKVLGSFDKKPLDSESKSRANARRSLVALKDIQQGEVVTFDHLTWKRPASGISPKDINLLIGKSALKDIKEDDVLKWNMFS